MTTEYMKQAEAVLDVIERNPENHDQEYWGVKEDEYCGTVACIAGHIALLNNDAHYIRQTRGYTLILNSHIEGQFENTEWKEYGQAKLGLSDHDANTLFMYTDNKEAKEALKYIAKGEDIPWKEILE